jgi:hypothetical protein
MDDLTLINGVRVEVGKEYLVQHRSFDSHYWVRVKISRLTVNGHPWMVNSNKDSSRETSCILTNTWTVKEITPELELEEFAKSWLLERGYKGFANNSEVPKWFAKMYNDFKQ